jgi:hypothetical protein
VLFPLINKKMAKQLSPVTQDIPDPLTGFYLDLVRKIKKCTFAKHCGVEQR